MEWMKAMRLTKLIIGARLGLGFAVVLAFAVVITVIGIEQNSPGSTPVIFGPYFLYVEQLLIPVYRKQFLCFNGGIGEPWDIPGGILFHPQVLIAIARIGRPTFFSIAVPFRSPG